MRRLSATRVSPGACGGAIFPTPAVYLGVGGARVDGCPPIFASGAIRNDNGVWLSVVGTDLRPGPDNVGSDLRPTRREVHGLDESIWWPAAGPSSTAVAAAVLGSLRPAGP